MPRAHHGKRAERFPNRVEHHAGSSFWTPDLVTFFGKTWRNIHRVATRASARRGARAFLISRVLRTIVTTRRVSFGFANRSPP